MRKRLNDEPLGDGVTRHGLADSVKYKLRRKETVVHTLVLEKMEAAC